MTFDTDFQQRFWARVDKNGPNGCWSWLGENNGKEKRGRVHLRFEPGVGSSKRGRRVYIYAYVVAWELTVGPVAPDMNVCHNCPSGDNPNCVNPAHLFVGTQQENLRDMRRKGRANSFGREKPVKRAA